MTNLRRADYERRLLEAYEEIRVLRKALKDGINEVINAKSAIDRREVLDEAIAECKAMLAECDDAQAALLNRVVAAIRQLKEH